jgi:hypothetical protein
LVEAAWSQRHKPGIGPARPGGVPTPYSSCVIDYSFGGDALTTNFVRVCTATRSGVFWLSPLSGPRSLADAGRRFASAGTAIGLTSVGVHPIDGSRSPDDNALHRRIVADLK